MTNIIPDGDSLQHLKYLLEFLAAWEKRPVCLTPMAYQWCSTISEAARRPGPSEPPDNIQQFRLRPRDLATGGLAHFLARDVEHGFSEVGPGCDPIRLGDASHRARRNSQALILSYHAHFISVTLEIAFHLVAPGHDQPALHLDHTSHHKWVFETAFSSHDDEVITDAVSAWIMDCDLAPPGSCARYFASRVERDTPFSPRLRWMTLRAIERIEPGELKVSGLEIVRLLNHLNIDMDEVEQGHQQVVESPI